MCNASTTQKMNNLYIVISFNTTFSPVFGTCVTQLHIRNKNFNLNSYKFSAKTS